MARDVLVVCMRRIGDVLLATPVAASIKAAWPDANVDMLVFKGTEGVLRGNPNLREVIAVDERQELPDRIALIRRLWRRYDHAISVQTGDRPTLMAWVAGRRSTGLVDGSSAFKRAMLDDAVAFDASGEHTVASNLKLLAPLGVAPIAKVTVSWDGEAEQRAIAAFPGVASGKPFAVLHVSPKFAYKTWTIDGWAGLAEWIASQGMTVVTAGGASPEERDYLAKLAPRMPAGTVDVSGKVDLAALAWLIARAKVYVGTDTAVTHMAAALGIPTVALFGPSSPVRWGPWPKDFPAGAASPWKLVGTQRSGNVLLVQGEDEDMCVPCLGEGCDKHVGSLSDCLQSLPAQRVIDAARKVMFPFAVMPG
jgi:lipopolysaccharide heptosyltransferase III